MATAAGDLNRFLMFLQRDPFTTEIVSPQPPRGGFSLLGYEWGSYQDMGEDEIQVSMLKLRARKGIVVVRDNPFTRGLTTAHRVVIDEMPMALTSIGPAPRSWGDLRINVTEAPSRSLYSRLMDQEGEVVTLRRTVPNAPALEVRVRALISGYEPNELVSGIVQNSRRVFLNAQDLEDQGFPIPPLVGDYIIAQTRRLRVDHVDQSTHRIAGEIHAYHIQATGQ